MLDVLIDINLSTILDAPTARRRRIALDSRITMSTIYLDHNILGIAACVPPDERATAMRAALNRLSRHTFVLSAWHAFELAKSKQDNYVASYCALVESLHPIWLSNNRFVLQAELRRFLEESTVDLRRFAFNTIVSQMWSTYGSGTPIVVGDTFTSTVREMRRAPRGIDEIIAAANETPAAILDGRAAADDGRLAENQPIIDAEYFASILGDSRPTVIDPLVANMREVLATCPAIAIEERMTQLRVRDRFKPTPNDAPDLQHAIVALAYCDYFVTDDKRFAEHCEIVVRDCRHRCSVHRALSEIAGS